MQRLITTATLFIVAAGLAQAEPRKGEQRRENRNYILRRQQVGAVQGVPVRRLIIGKREIDIYSSGQMFERDQLIGVTR
jgi:hypothetical protein